MPEAKKIKMVCRHCRGENFLADAYAEWDVETQKWYVQNVFDKGGFCADCDGEARCDEVELTVAELEELAGEHRPHARSGVEG